MGDEGYILHSAQRLHSGEIPYKDFNFIYTPGSIYVISAVFCLLGESILTGKIIVIFIAAITSIFIYLISYRIVKIRPLAISSVLIYLAWGPSHINFPFPVNFCIFTGITSLYIFLKIVEKPTIFYHVLLGIMVFITFYFKQNFGFALFWDYLILFILFKKIRTKKIILFFFAFFIGLAIFLLYLILTQSISGFITYSNYAYTEYFILHTVVAPFPYDLANPVGIVLKMFVYLLPLILSIFTIVISLSSRNKIEWIASSLFVLFYYLVGIYPSTDYVHISPLLSLVGLPLVILSNYKKFKLYIVIYVLIICVIIGGFYTAFFKGYYRWGAPMTQ
jgi:hypothetical protein